MLFFLAEPLFAKTNKDSICVKDCCSKKPHNTNNPCTGICNPFFSCIYCQYIPKKTIEITDLSQPITSKSFEFTTQDIAEGCLLACWKPPNYFML